MEKGKELTRELVANVIKSMEKTRDKQISAG
jgi:hypothetical protein